MIQTKTRIDCRSICASIQNCDTFTWSNQDLKCLLKKHLNNRNQYGFDLGTLSSNLTLFSSKTKPHFDTQAHNLQRRHNVKSCINYVYLEYESVLSTSLYSLILQSLHIDANFPIHTPTQTIESLWKPFLVVTAVWDRFWPLGIPSKYRRDCSRIVVCMYYILCKCGILCMTK